MISMIRSRQVLTVGISLSLIWSSLPLSTPMVLAAPIDQQNSIRFDPNQAVHIRVFNRTPHPLEYGLADPFPQIKEVQAGEQIELFQVRVPNCLGINTPMLAPVQYQVSAGAGNWIEVEVQVSPEIYGVHCLELQLDGGVYVY